MERNLKEQIVKSASAVKRKVKMIKNIKNTNDMALETIFQPIVSPLKLLASKTEKKRHEEDEKESLKYGSHEKFEESETDLDDEENSDNDDFNSKTPDKTLTTSPSEDYDIHENSFKSIQSSPSIANDSLSWSASPEALKEDIPYGVRSERGKLWLGKTRLHDDGKVLKIRSRSLKKTSGLAELLYKKKPNLDIITEEDLQNYKLLLIDTNAHKRNWKPSNQINGNKGFKYTRVIKPLFKFARNNTSSVESLQRGEGINILKEVKKDTDLVYWNDPNELVERLKILCASRAAGNTGLDNEVNAILEEMKEAGIIKKMKYIRLPSGKFSSSITLQNLARRQ